METYAVPSSEETRYVRRFLTTIVALLVLLNLLVAVGLYFHFVPQPVDTLLRALPILLPGGFAVIVLAVGIGFVRWLIAAQRPQPGERRGKAGPGTEGQQHRAG